MNHMPLIDRPPPCDLAAEAACLGSVLIKPSELDAIVGAGLKPEHFYDDANRILFATLSDMHEAGVKLDTILIVSELKRRGGYEAVGGMAYLGRLSSTQATASHARFYSDIVREKWAQRVILDGCVSLAGKVAEQDSKESAEVLTSLAGSITESSAVTFTTMADACTEVAESLHAGTEGEIKTGLEKLDQITRGGLKPNQLTIIAAATSVGKSALAIEIADNAAQAGYRVLYVTLEMTGPEIVRERLLPRHDQTSKPTAEILADLSRLPITFIDKPGLTIANIRGFARLTAARDGLDLLVIDHIGCVAQKAKDQYSRTTEISRQLMTLPKELGIPVLALSQVNRESSKGEKMACPRLDQLRDSGSLEQDAHNVWILHRETRFDQNAELVVAKQRNGPVGKLKLIFDLRHQRFDDMSTPAVSRWDPNRKQGG